MGPSISSQVQPYFGTIARAVSQNSESPLPIDCPSWTAADFDNDGRTDLACGTKHLLNRTVSGNNWIGVNLTGVKNIKSGAGAEVEIKAGSRYQKKLYAGSPVTFGLGTEKMTETVRITWPNGLIQNEIKQAAGKIYKYEEAQRLSGSCPIIWSWNGREFEYITDVLGVAPLGASSGDGKYFPVDHDEYVQISGKSLVPVDGEYRHPHHRGTQRSRLYRSPEADRSGPPGGDVRLHQ